VSGGGQEIGGVMSQLKVMLKKQAAEQHKAALLEGIATNCMSACDGGGRSKLGKSLHYYYYCYRSRSHGCDIFYFLLIFFYLKFSNVLEFQNFRK